MFMRWNALRRTLAAGAIVRLREAGACWLILLGTACLLMPPASDPVSAKHDPLGVPVNDAPLVGAEEGRMIPAYPQVATFAVASADEKSGGVRLCQAFGPGCGVPCGACERPIFGVDCQNCDNCGEKGWDAWGPIPWQAFAHGEYIGPARPPHVMEYRLRVDDQLEFVYRLTREELSAPYRLNVGDRIRVESLIDDNIDRQELLIQPDGSITLRLLGQVNAARRTVAELTAMLEEQYKQYYKVPAITITPLEVNTKLEDLRAAVDSRFGAGGQSRTARVAPDGSIQLVALGSIPAQGLTLHELKQEIDLRYANVVRGIEVTPVLLQRAPRYIYVLGEVAAPGQFALTGPTTVMQSIALAGSWNNGGNLRHVVVFRRGEDWRLLATRLDLQGALLGKRPCPADEIWLRDGDIVVIPKTPMLLTDDYLELLFTRGIYAVFPLSASVNFSKFSTL